MKATYRTLVGAAVISTVVACKGPVPAPINEGPRQTTADVVNQPVRTPPTRQEITPDASVARTTVDASVAVRQSQDAAVRLRDPSTRGVCTTEVAAADVYSNYEAVAKAILCATPQNIFTIATIKCRTANQHSDAGSHTTRCENRDAELPYAFPALGHVYDVLSGARDNFPPSGLTTAQVRDAPISKAFRAYLEILRSNNEETGTPNLLRKIEILQRFVNFSTGAPDNCADLATEMADSFNRRQNPNGGANPEVYIPANFGTIPAAVSANTAVQNAFGGSRAEQLFAYYAADVTYLTRQTGDYQFTPSQTRYTSDLFQHTYFARIYAGVNCGGNAQENDGGVRSCNAETIISQACASPRAQFVHAGVTLEAVAVLEYRLTHLTESDAPKAPADYVHMNQRGSRHDRTPPAWVVNE
jgi:hypothetical protein